MRKPGKISRERSAYFYSENNDEKDKYFFKVLVGNFRERLVSFQVRPLCVPGNKWEVFLSNFCCGQREYCVSNSLISRFVHFAPKIWPLIGADLAIPSSPASLVREET
jgi:hypothetical protein